MNIQQLIEKLSQFPLDTRVVLYGKEGGFRDIDSEDIEMLGITLNAHTEHYYGPHEAIEDGQSPDENALLLD